MTKSELVLLVSQRNGLPKEHAEIAVNTFFDTLITGLKNGRRVELRGFGTFQMREYHGYLGRNPRTGDSVPIAPKRLPHFKQGKEIRESLNTETITNERD